MGMTIAQAEDWINDNDEIIRQFKCLFDLSIGFGEQWLQEKMADLYKRLQKEGGFTYAECVWFENNAVSRTNYSKDNVVNNMMLHNGYSGETVGLHGK